MSNKSTCGLAQTPHSFHFATPLLVETEMLVEFDSLFFPQCDSFQAMSVRKVPIFDSVEQEPLCGLPSHC